MSWALWTTIIPSVCANPFLLVRPLFFGYVYSAILYIPDNPLPFVTRNLPSFSVLFTIFLNRS